VAELRSVCAALQLSVKDLTRKLHQSLGQAFDSTEERQQREEVRWRLDALESKLGRVEPELTTTLEAVSLDVARAMEQLRLYEEERRCLPELRWLSQKIVGTLAELETRVPGHETVVPRADPEAQWMALWRSMDRNRLDETVLESPMLRLPLPTVPEAGLMENSD